MENNVLSWNVALDMGNQHGFTLTLERPFLWGRLKQCWILKYWRKKQWASAAILHKKRRVQSFN